jgi:hypothetical protein
MRDQADRQKEALRSKLIEMYRNFDLRAGHFGSLTYVSPREVVTQDCAIAAKHSATELRDAVTAWRTDRECKNGINAETIELMHDLKEAMRVCKTDEERRPSADPSPWHSYRNKPEIEKLLANSLAMLGLGELLIESGAETLSLTGSFNDAIGHRVGVNVQVKWKYDGVVWSTLSFPYFDRGDPTIINLRLLAGHGLYRFLDIAPPSLMEWRVDRGKDAFPQTDRFLAILQAVIGSLVDDHGA